MIIIVSGSSLGTSARLSVAPTSSIPRVNVPSYSAQADRAVSASYALSASWSPSAELTQTGSFTGSLSGSMSGSAHLDYGTTVRSVQEYVDFRPAIGTGTSSFDYTSGSIFHLGGMTGNGAWNIVNVPTTPGLVSTFSFLISQGATPYSASSYHINSVPVTVRWAAGNPITGSANRVDMFGLTAIRSGSSWVVLGSSNTFA